jgi:hypothetical protein
VYFVIVINGICWSISNSVIEAEAHNIKQLIKIPIGVYGFCNQEIYLMSTKGGGGIFGRSGLLPGFFSGRFWNIGLVFNCRFPGSL